MIFIVRIFIWSNFRAVLGMLPINKVDFSLEWPVGQSFRSSVRDTSRFTSAFAIRSFIYLFRLEKGCKGRGEIACTWSKLCFTIFCESILCVTFTSFHAMCTGGYKRFSIVFPEVWILAEFELLIVYIAAPLDRWSTLRQCNKTVFRQTWDTTAATTTTWSILVKTDS